MAVMSALRRTAIGGFRVEEALSLHSLTEDNWTEHLLPPRRAVEQIPQVIFDEQQVRRLLRGQAIVCETAPRDADEIAALDSTGRLIALLVPDGPVRLWPVRVFAGD
jgi:tRNA pseudouridine55 synthase